ncbi:MAG: 50S ribosomal protein L6 [Alphaproteobacteria bacterium]|nr:50S ribosomal protein L6 [Alphaproteobacteria bacterium]
MSKIGKHPVVVPAGVTATLSDDEITINGKLGTLKTHILSGVSVESSEGLLTVKPLHDTKQSHAAWGTMRANIANMIKGVTEGFSRKMELIGVGYRAQVSGQKLKLTLGFSHDINYELPAGVKAVVTDQTKLELTSADKQLVGQVAAEIRSYRKPEPYKGKGIKYAEETILRKEGKKK